jgi:phytoene desaturase (3,4-didehydrolycopene-forming)
MVLLPVGNAQDVAGNGAAAGAVDWDPLVVSGREAVLRRLEEAGVRVVQPDGGAECSLREAIASEFVYTPKDWEHMYSVKYGAAFGLAHGLSQISYLRPDNGPRGDEEPDGLYFVGASTRPGNGVPLVLTGAKITSERILGDLGIINGLAQ